jgi:hypothetical protein
MRDQELIVRGLDPSLSIFGSDSSVPVSAHQADNGGRFRAKLTSRGVRVRYRRGSYRRRACACKTRPPA